MNCTRGSGLASSASLGLGMLLTWLLCSPSAVVWGQSDRLSDPPQVATSAEQLMLEQIDDLIAAGEFGEALSSLQKVYDQGAHSLIAAGGVQRAATLRVQRYIPLRQWCQAKTEQMLSMQPALQPQLQQQLDALATAALATLQADKDLVEAKRVANRYRLSSVGEDLTLFLADLYLEQGWGLAALSVLDRATPELRYAVGSDADPIDGRISLAWPQAWARATTDAERARLLAAWQSSQPPTSDWRWLTQVLQRSLTAAAMQPDIGDQRNLDSWVTAVAGSLDSPHAESLAAFLAEARSWAKLPQASSWSTFAGNASRCSVGSDRFDLGAWPVWSQQLERFTASSDRIAASQPRVGESARGTLPYFPVVSDGKLLINEMNRIRAFDLESGRAWPEIEPPLPLFDSHISTASYVPLGYPLVGTPRGTLVLADDCVYARMGSPVTGWANRESAEDGGSLSYLVGLDLKKQGSLLRGFPLRLTEPEFQQAEFEGCPLVWGDLLIVAVVERDNVGVRRSVAAFDRFSGELAWRSRVLAAGTPEGSDRANLITHQLLTAAGGRLFVNTNLGAIVCLDPLTGETEWLVRYDHLRGDGLAYPSPDRFRYRDLTPCLVAGGLVLCMPRDCGELFALEAAGGNLVWSTDDAEVADAIHLLGVQGESLLVSGDRLRWLNLRTGITQARFPGPATPGPVNALPTPRGLGRGVISGGVVYWPVAGEVFVFPGDLSTAAPAGTPPILERFPMDSRGNEGGNLLTVPGYLVYCGPSRMLVFQAKPNIADELTLR